MKLRMKPEMISWRWKQKFSDVNQIYLYIKVKIRIRIILIVFAECWNSLHKNLVGENHYRKAMVLESRRIIALVLMLRKLLTSQLNQMAKLRSIKFGLHWIAEFQ